MKLVFCLPGDTFTSSFLLSFARTMAVLGNAGHKISISNMRSADIYRCRNGCVFNRDVALLDGTADPVPFNGQEYDFAIWIDSDQGWVAEDILKLIGHNKDICSGVVSLSGAGHVNAGYYKEGAGIVRMIAPFETDSIVTVDWIGLAFCVMKFGVLEKIGYPWFKPYYAKGVNDRELLVSEDIGFCLNAKEKGIQVWVDTSVRVSHDKRVTLEVPTCKPTQSTTTETTEQTTA